MTTPSDTLLIDDDDRYSRLRLIGWWDQDKLAAAKVLVVGAGAIGNEVLKNLALVGIGDLYIVDFDEIEQSNLARSVLYRASDCGRPKAEVAANVLRELNPDSRIRAVHGNVITDVGLGLFAAVDVVIGCLDNREARLWVNRQCWKVGTPWVDGGIQEINGVVKVFVPPGDACYECGMTDIDYQLINLRYSCPLLPREDILAGKVPTAPTISSIIGGLQAQEALKIIHGFEVEAGKAMVFNGITNQFYKTQFQRKPDCLSHETFGEAPLALDLTTAATANEVFREVERRRPEHKPTQLVLDRELVVSLDCRACQHKRTVLQPRHSFRIQDATCDRCDEVTEPQLVHRIGRDEPLADESLARVGVPPYDIVRIEGEQGELFCLLAGDEDAVLLQPE